MACELVMPLGCAAARRGQAALRDKMFADDAKSLDELNVF
jgi:hypothetical protein